MGTDIHIFVEFYDIHKGYWVLMRYNDDTEMYEPANLENEPELAPGQEYDAEFEEKYDEWLDSIPSDNVHRNYDLFAYLADVRNTDKDPIVPLSQPKGFPDDMSRDTKIVARCGGNCHSHTWFSAEELITVIWDEVLPPMHASRYGPIKQLDNMIKRCYKQDRRSRLLICFDN